MRGLGLPRRTAIAAAAVLLLLIGTGAGVGVWLHSRPVLHLATSAQECINAPDHVASLFSDDQNTLIRISNLDYSDIRTLRVEPAGRLPGMFDSLLALSGNSSRLAYVTADDELMDGARIQYVDVSSPAETHPVADVAQGLAPVRPAWSPDASQLAYVIGRAPANNLPAAFEVWAARGDGATPPQKVAELPVDVFARGHSASLCWTPAGQIGLLMGVQSAAGQVGPSPLSGAGAVSAPRTEAPTPLASPTPNGSPCGVPVFSQNDPTWRAQVMQLGGDAIGGYGCALTATSMLLNYYGSVLTPSDLNACLGPAADPIVWSSAPACTAGKVGGGIRNDFSWDVLDAFLKAGKPVIVGMLRGLTGSHFVVVTQGGGGVADDYRITDPWDGSTVKTLASYTDAGYNPRWVVSYDGPGQNCARLVPGGARVGGFQDGGTTKGGVTVDVPKGGGDTTVEKVPTGTGGTTPASPSPSPSASASPSPSESPSASPSASPTASAGPTPSPGGGARTWRVRAGTRLTLVDEGVYLVYIRRPGPPPHVTILKFTIDRTPPVLSLRPLNQLGGGGVHAALGRAFTAYTASAADQSGLVLTRPGRLRLGAVDPLSGVDRIDYQLDGGALTTYSDDTSFVRTLTVDQVGTHTISLRATDAAGNVAVANGLTFDVVDTATPSPSPTPKPTPTPTRRPTPTPVSTPVPTPTPLVLTVSPTLTVMPPPVQPCVATYTVSGTITLQGGSGPVTVTYQWVHNGQTIASTGQLPFNGPGSMTVSERFVVQSSGTMQTDQLRVVGPLMAASNPVVLSCFVIG